MEICGLFLDTLGDRPRSLGASNVRSPTMTRQAAAPVEVMTFREWKDKYEGQYDERKAESLYDIYVDKTNKRAKAQLANAQAEQARREVGETLCARWLSDCAPS